MNFDQEIYDSLKKDVDNAFKRVSIYKTDRSRKLPTCKSKLTEYKDSMVICLNRYSDYVLKFYSTFSEENKKKSQDNYKASLTKLIELLDYIGFKINQDLPTYFCNIDNDLIIDKQPKTISSSTPSQSAQTVAQNTVAPNINDNLTAAQDQTHTVQHTDNVPQLNLSQTEEMAQSKEKLLKSFSSKLNYKYNGEPHKLPGFINDIEVIEEIVEDQNKDYFYKLVVGTLAGKALKALKSSVKSIEDLKESLKSLCKPQRSEVIEAKMLGLRLDKLSNTEFAKQVEDLSDALHFCYVAEDYSCEKATRLTIKKTIECCRKQTKLGEVRSVLTSTAHESPADVVALLLTESNTVRQEMLDDNRRHNNQNQRGNFRNGRFNRNNNFRGNNRPNNGQSNNNNSRNFNQRGSIGHNNGYQNRDGRNNYANSSRGNNRNEHTIRVVSGNSQAPQTRENNNEQIFRIPL